MFSGHIGVALAIGRAERRVNPGVFIVAALLLDVVLWVCVLLGWESVSIPADYPRHQPKFIFPYSHSLLASLVWSALGGFVTYVMYYKVPNRVRLRVAALVVLAINSHWVLDVLVHEPELPLFGTASKVLGLGLWKDLPLALVVETAIVLAGLLLFVPGSHLSRFRKLACLMLTLITLGFTIIGMTLVPAPPSIPAMAGSSLITIIIVCILYYLIGRKRGHGVGA